MPKLTDMQIRAWIKAGERFEGRADGNGLYLRYREADKTPTWRFRYKLAGKSRAMLIGSYSELSLSKARETAKELSARVALGYDVAGEKQERKSTLPVALAKVRAEMPDVPNFTIHDFRRTARTHLAALGVDPVVAERCLNHKIKGVEGIYNRHQYFDERRAALTQWAGLLVALERGEEYNVTPLRKAK
ncbi:integrase family protein [Escherichia coli]|uniref:integrase family protein n=1 Tax=Escherichia coli TaxID=562 RepID=UPI002FE53F0D